MKKKSKGSKSSMLFQFDVHIKKMFFLTINQPITPHRMSDSYLALKKGSKNYLESNYLDISESLLALVLDLLLHVRNGGPTAGRHHHNQGCRSAFISSGSGSSSRILGWIPIRIQGFKDQKMEKNYCWKRIKFFLDQKLQFTYP
jgi:hypothetical protein